MTIEASEIHTTSPLLQRVMDRIGHCVDRMREDRPNRVFLEISPVNLVEVTRALFWDMGARLATASGVDLRDEVEINYHFCFDRDQCVVTVKTWAVKPDPQIDSITPLIPAAEWIEREINDLIGCNFINHPRLERLILADDWPEGVHPLSREYRP